MMIPANMTEAEVLRIIDKVANGLAYKFRFGYNSIDDMKQYARLFAIQGLDRYNAALGTVETFLWTHVRNRLSNLKRDHYERPDRPCFKCPHYDPHREKSSSQCVQYDDKDACDLYRKWTSRNSRKKNVLSPIDIDSVHDEHEDGMKIFADAGDALDYKQIVGVIDQTIPANLRSLWIKFLNDIPLPKPDKEKLFGAIRQILRDEGLYES